MGICTSNNTNDKYDTAYDKKNKEYNELKPYASRYGFASSEHLRRKIHSGNTCAKGDYGSDKALRAMRTDYKVGMIHNSNKYCSYSRNRHNSF